eukprot:9141249-Pyramimonas_sp.AAC.1
MLADRLRRILVRIAIRLVACVLGAQPAAVQGRLGVPLTVQQAPGAQLELLVVYLEACPRP